MARLTDKDKELILADFHTNKYSQRELSKKYECSLGTINNITKAVIPENEHLVNAQIALLSAKAYLSNEQLNAIMNTAKDEIFNKGLVTNASQLALVRSTEQLVKNTKKEMTRVKQYNNKGQISGETIELFEIELNSQDIKNIQDTVDKASITLGVNQRHSNQQINVNTQNNNNLNHTELNQEIVKNTLNKFEDEY